MSSPPRTVLAFDFGLRQIGVAVGNCVLGTTQALTVLKAKDGTPDWQVVTRLIEEWQPDLLVVGDPINMDGSPSELSARAARFGRRLQGRTGLGFELCDERLSSFEAKQALREEGHRGDYRRDPVDSYAAELILKTWLAERER